jgi:hypothetical protein
MDSSDYDFETDFQLFMRGVRSVTPMNEEIERIYWQLARKPPEACSTREDAAHVSEQCYFSGFRPPERERGEAI